MRLRGVLMFCENLKAIYKNRVRWEFLSKIISIYIHTYIQHVTDGFSIEMHLVYCDLFAQAASLSFAHALVRVKYLVVGIDTQNSLTFVSFGRRDVCRIHEGPNTFLSVCR